MLFSTLFDFELNNWLCRVEFEIIIFFLSDNNLFNSNFKLFIWVSNTFILLLKSIDNLSCFLLLLSFWYRLIVFFNFKICSSLSFKTFLFDSFNKFKLFSWYFNLSIDIFWLSNSSKSAFFLSSKSVNWCSFSSFVCWISAYFLFLFSIFFKFIFILSESISIFDDKDWLFFWIFNIVSIILQLFWIFCWSVCSSSFIFFCEYLLVKLFL